jgi:ABC-type multidrug transport system fused ATPase/permease subunit
VLSDILDNHKDQSVLLITHRLVEMDRMDEILVLSQGRILERGCHVDLLAAEGLYWQMWVLQNQAILA